MTMDHGARRGADSIRARALTLAWGGTDFRQVRRWGRLFAALLFVLGAAAGAPEAWAQQVLVSNLGKTSADDFPLGQRIDQAFHTGNNARGYTLTSIQLRLGDGLGMDKAFPEVKLYSGAANGTLVDTLTPPGGILNYTSNFTFTASGNISLEQNTDYWIVVVGANTLGKFFVTTDLNEDANPDPGWNIADLRSGTTDFSYMISVNGHINANSPPVFPQASLTRAFDENTAANVNIGAATPAATDADVGDSLTYSMEGTDAALFNFNVTTRQITTKTGVTYDFETKSGYSVTIKVDDNNGGSDTVDVTINLNDVDEPPTAPAAPAVAATSGSTTSLDVSWTAPENSGKPAITSYDLQYREGASGSFTDGPQDVTGTSTTIAGLNSGTSYQVQVRATNDEGDSGWSDSGSGSTSAPLVAETTRDIWTATVVIATHTNPATGLVGYGPNFPSSSISSGTFTAGSTTYTVDQIYSVPDTAVDSPVYLYFSPLPSTAATRNWTLHIGTHSIRFSDLSRTGSWNWVDSSLWSRANTPFIHGASITMRISVPNSAPAVANKIPDQSATVGNAFTYQFPDNTFNDTDTGDTLSYMATKADGAKLPEWLGFDATTRTFTGTPATTDVETFTVKVTATDTGSATVSSDFDITVSAAPTTETTFISNTGQTTITSPITLRATAFTTGAGTYTLSSVAILVFGQNSTTTPLVQIYTDTSNNPGTLVATMTNPATLAGNAVNIFTAPANTTLAANTTYWVTTSNSAAAGGGFGSA